MSALFPILYLKLHRTHPPHHKAGLQSHHHIQSHCLPKFSFLDKCALLDRGCRSQLFSVQMVNFCALFGPPRCCIQELGLLFSDHDYQRTNRRTSVLCGIHFILLSNCLCACCVFKVLPLCS